MPVIEMIQIATENDRILSGFFEMAWTAFDLKSNQLSGRLARLFIHQFNVGINANIVCELLPKDVAKCRNLLAGDMNSLPPLIIGVVAFHSHKN
jgi:hypothetical protein